MDGNIFFISAARDISERKRAEEALRDREARYRYLFEYSQVANALVGLDGKIIDVNQAAAELYGYDKSEIIGMDLLEFVAPESKAKVTEAFASGLVHSHADPGEVEVAAKGGMRTFFFPGGYYTLFEGGKETGFLISVVDVTERKQAEEALAKSEEKYRTVLEGMGESYYEVDLAGNFTFFNDALCRQMGYSREELMGMNYQVYTPPEDVEKVFKIYNKVYRTGEPVQVDMEEIRKDGMRLFFENSVLPLRNEKGEIIGFRGIGRDVTERKRDEEKMWHLNLVLRAIRNVNQLIARGADRDTLFKGVCENFVKTRGYYNAWIALLDESGKLVTAVEAGLGKDFLQMIERLKRGELPDCGRKALEKSGVVLIEDPPSVCTDCPLAKDYSGRGDMSIRLEYGGKVYGLVTISAPLGFLSQKEESDLFEEVAGDIAFALYSMEQEEERSRAGEALRDSEERYRRLIETAYEGVWIVDDEGRTTFVNARMAEMLGYTTDEMIDKPLFLFMDEGWRAVADKMLGRRRIGIVEQYEFNFRRKDGSELWTTIAASPISDKDGRYAGSLRMVTDITERKWSEEALAEEATRRRILMDQSRDGISILDENSKLVEANQRFAEMLGYTPKELRELHSWDWDTQWTREELLEMGRSVDEAGAHLETRHRRKDGTVFDVELSVNSAVVAGKKLIFCVSRDITERKQAEEALRRSEQNFRDSMENSPLGIRILNKDGKTLYANRALLDMWGYSSVEELEAVPRKQRYAPESYDEHRERVEKRKRGEHVSLNYELSIMRSDGQVRHLSASRGELLWNGESQFQVVYQDITERKQAELALQKSEQKHYSLVEDTSVGIASIDMAGNLTFVNRAACNLSGYAESKMLGKPFADFVYPDDVQPVIELFLGAAADQRDSVDMEFRVIDRKGRIIHLHASVTRVKQENETVGFNTIMTDITERKRIEEELRTSHAYLDRIINSIVEVLMVVDTDYNIIDINRSFLQYYGGKRKDIIGRKCYEVLHLLSEPCSTAQRRCPLRTVLKTGRPFHAEHTYEMVEGREFIFEISMFPLVDSAGNIEAVVEMQHDITESKRAEEEKGQLEQKAQVASRLASVGEMAAGIAHEINNPLTSVIGYSQLLSERDDIAEDVRMDLKAIDEGAQRVAGVIKRLLTFARQTRPERTLANVNELITNTLDLRAYHLRTNNIKVTTELADDLPITTADPAQLQQVFLNIIVNAETAMKLARGKGKLLIKTEEWQYAEEVNGTIRISFKDNGPGIASENLERIFDPFFTTREVGQGTGLGLSICHGIIAEHKGRIWVESEVGKGSTFIVELPIVIESTRLEVVEPVGKKPQKVPRAKILVVDDEPSTLEFLSRLLTNEGHEVDTVSNAAEAFEMVKDKRYSLILLDIKMPGASGIELYGRMQKIAQSFAERVIFITGDIMGTDTEAFLSRTKAPYITKPFDVNQLKKKIEHFLFGGQ
jgi:PAS domain S-box-containing protein